MSETAPIIASEIQPWSTTESAMPALTTAIPHNGTTCLVGPDSQLLSDYLRLLGGVDDISSGELYLFGIPLRELSRQQWRQIRLKLGYVTRTAPLLSVMSGLENVVLPALYHKAMSRQEAEIAAHYLLEELHCRADLNLLPAYLTPLQRMQLSIARAAILAPPVLLLEEPFHGFDFTQYDTLNRFLQGWSLNHALILSTANLHFVKKQAERIIFIGNDRILRFDSWDSFSGSQNPIVLDYLKQYYNNHDI